MKFLLSKPVIGLFLVLIVLAVLFAINHESATAPTPKPHLPMIPSGSPELATLLSRVDPIEGLRLMTANHAASDDAFRVSGLAQTREKISEYLGALEQIGLRNYVLEVNDSPEDSALDLSFLITGKLKIAN